MKSTQAKAAAEIRKYLKEKGIPAKVTSQSASMTSSVRIKVSDLHPDIFEEIEQHCMQYQYGHFDGMQDLYEYSNARNDIPQVKFVFVNNFYSDELRQLAWNYIRSTCHGADICPEKVSDLTYSDQVFNDQATRIIWRLLNGSMDDLSKNFWKSLEKQVESIQNIQPENDPDGDCLSCERCDESCPDIPAETFQDWPHEKQETSPALTVEPCLNCVSLLSDARIEEHTHTKTGKKMFIVVPADRFKHEVFLQLRECAKAMKGWWSWYKGAPNGFAFNSRQEAELFVGKDPAPLSPVIEQYNEIQSQLSGVLFYRTGDFYQVFGEQNCNVIAKYLQKNITMYMGVPNCAIHIKAFNQAYQILYENGFKVCSTEEELNYLDLPLNYLDLPLNCSPLPYTNPMAIDLKAIADEMQAEIDRCLTDSVGISMSRIVFIERKRFQGLRLQRTQKVLYRLAELHEADRVPDILRQFINKESVYEWMGSKPNMIVKGLYNYPVCTGKPYYDTDEAIALWKLLK